LTITVDSTRSGSAPDQQWWSGEYFHPEGLKRPHCGADFEQETGRTMAGELRQQLQANVKAEKLGKCFSLGSRIITSAWCSSD